ncbi:hypothetical protein CL634_09005 [bacterium]|nr:hypothetical protein [bacterium]
MSAIAVYPPSGSSGELQFVNSSGLLDAAQCFWDSSKSKLFVSGNLEVLGTETVIDTQHLQIEDAIIGLGSGSAGEGSPGDRGLVFLISGETNPSFYWDESESEFRLSRVTNVPGDSSFNDPVGAGEGGYQRFRAGSIFSDTAEFSSGLSGSLTQLTDGKPYLVSGAAISITTGSSGSVIISAASTVRKHVYEITSSHEAQSPVTIPNLDVSDVDSNPDKIDVFVNGQLMTSGTLKDYVLSGESDKVEFYFNLLSDDIITVRTY